MYEVLLCHVYPPVRKIIHSLKVVDYLHVQADNPWYNYYARILATIDMLSLFLLQLHVLVSSVHSTRNVSSTKLITPPTVPV